MHRICINPAMTSVLFNQIVGDWKKEIHLLHGNNVRRMRKVNVHNSVDTSGTDNETLTKMNGEACEKSV